MASFLGLSQQLQASLYFPVNLSKIFRTAILKNKHKRLPLFVLLPLLPNWYGKNKDCANDCPFEDR